MKISTILDYIDNGHMALPEFQRGFVWTRDKVRWLFDSLYHKYPVGSLLVWGTESQTAIHRGDGPITPGVVKLLLDGQQRLTSLYGVVRGKPPKFFDGDAQAFTGLYFHLASETFEFYQPVKMKDDSLWINVSELFQKGHTGHGEVIQRLLGNPEYAAHVGEYSQRLGNLLGIIETDLHDDTITGADKSLDVVVDIFNRVNSGGTKLSKGDLALAKICAAWPDGRQAMKVKLKEWEHAGYNFTLDWLLRSMNTVLTGEAQFLYLHGRDVDEVQNALEKAERYIDTCLNLIGGRLGLDHDRVLFGRFGIPVMARYLDLRNQQHLGPMDDKERDKLLFWFVQAGMWGRFSGSTEANIDKDLGALEGENGGLDNLLETLRLWHGGLRAEPGHFSGWSLGARFYPVLYMLTRMGNALDLGTGLPLKANLLGKMNKLEVHHIFPKAQLYKRKYDKSAVNALANFCFLIKDSNLSIRDRLPEEYFPEVEQAHPGVLASQWIPMDTDLWKIENFSVFLNARKELLAEELNRHMEDLLHGDTRWLSNAAAMPDESVVGDGLGDEEEDAQLEDLNAWMVAQNLPRGILSFDLTEPETGQQRAVIDLVWPRGILENLTQPVAVLLNEKPGTVALANEYGLRCFTSVASFQKYVESEVHTVLE
ncbi:MAG: DUF262 domain-containing protein [Desulfovibrio sp.]|jgi:hypothetical protein|nr:DUF262 domain-containing protein [Desulfovibrio sp.]